MFLKSKENRYFNFESTRHLFSFLNSLKFWRLDPIKRPH